ncbi:MAG: NAD(P)-dependent alcohol dehydrogenase [Planctomycetota bacterium]
MKAAVRHKYGPPEVLNVEEVQTPIPADDELLVRVHAASVNLGDWEILTAKPLYITVLARIFGPRPRHRVISSNDGSASSRRGGFFKPRYKILGADIAGRVESVGKDVTQFQPGDEVFGDCFLGGGGAFAEYVCVPETAALVPKPGSMTFEQAAAMPQAAAIALRGLRDKAQVQPGQKVLINGAGGGAGTFAVQIAKLYGAEVTGVDGPGKLELLRSIGADHVIDYTEEDFTQNGQCYDAILDMAAYRSVFRSRRSLTPNGIYLMTGGSWRALWQSVLLGPLISRTGKGRVAFLMAEPSREILTHMKELFEAGRVVPIIDRCYPLSETGEAIRRLGEKHSQGKVIITP